METSGSFVLSMRARREISGSFASTVTIAVIAQLALLAIGELADPTSARHLMLRAYQAAEDDKTRLAAASALSRLEVRARNDDSKSTRERSTGIAASALFCPISSPGRR